MICWTFSQNPRKRGKSHHQLYINISYPFTSELSVDVNIYFNSPTDTHNRCEHIDSSSAGLVFTILYSEVIAGSFNFKLLIYYSSCT